MRARRWASLLATTLTWASLAGLAGCGGGSTTPTPPAPSPTATIAVAPAAATVAAGQSTTVMATVTRGGGFADAVTISVSGAPAGVTANGGTIAATATSVAVTIVTTTAATPGTVNLTVNAAAPGVTIAPVSLALTITPPPAASLGLSATTATVTAGQSTTVTATVARTGGFDGPVTIAAGGAPAGVTVTGGIIAAGATEQVVTIATAGSAAVGTVELSVTATATGLTIAPVALPLTVEAAASGQIGEPIKGEAGSDQASIVALSSDGSRVIIGARFNDAAGSNAGHARVFQRSGNAWVELGADLDGEAADDRYGGAVAISDDGNRIAIGSYLNDGGGSSSGHVRVFTLIDGNWVQLGTDIDGPDGTGSGWSLAMSASGHRVVVGGPSPNSVNGVVTIYEYVGAVWTQVGDRFAGGLETGDAVSMSADGNRIAYSQTSAAGTTQPGSVQVHDWNGTTWTQVGSTIRGETDGDTAGAALSFSTDGNTLAIGAPRNDDGGTTGGQVRVYRLVGGVWTQLGADLDGPAGATLGMTVSLSGDASRLLAGGPGAGIAARFYQLIEGAWVLQTDPAFVIDRRAGSSVAISRDGVVAAVGAEFGDGAVGNASGIVRVYALPAP